MPYRPPLYGIKVGGFFFGAHRGVGVVRELSSILVWRNLGKLTASFSANFFSEFYLRSFRPCFSRASIIKAPRRNNEIGTSPAPRKNPKDPAKTGNFMGMRFACRKKSPKIPAAHKIGATISGPRIAGAKF